MNYLMIMRIILIINLGKTLLQKIMIMFMKDWSRMIIMLRAVDSDGRDMKGQWIVISK